MLDATMKTQLQAYLQNLRAPIRLIATLGLPATRAQNCVSCCTRSPSLSDKVSVEESGAGSARDRLSVVAKEGESRGVRFAAIPVGTRVHFAGVWRCCGPVATRPRWKPRCWSKSKAWTPPASWRCYMSLSCHNCPDVVQAATLMADLQPPDRHHRDRWCLEPSRGR
jgi:alkyl hydroperoxide reductase subunit F